MVMKYCSIWEIRILLFLLLNFWWKTANLTLTLIHGLRGRDDGAEQMVMYMQDFILSNGHFFLPYEYVMHDRICFWCLRVRNCSIAATSIPNWFALVSTGRDSSKEVAAVDFLPFNWSGISLTDPCIPNAKPSLNTSQLLSCFFYYYFFACNVCAKCI